jgi:hypothetical protein
MSSTNEGGRLNKGGAPTAGARWKKLRGEGREAIHRAICGAPRCPGALGELAYFAGAAQQTARMRDEALRELRRLEVAVAEGASIRHFFGWDEDGDPQEALADAREQVAQVERIAMTTADLPETALPRVRIGWLMSASSRVRPGRGGPVDLEAVYAGYPDTGFRISRGGKRSSDGMRVGRRRFLPKDLSPGFLNLYGTHSVQGQNVGPTDRIYCPVCGTLNQLDWPEDLQESTDR